MQKHSCTCIDCGSPTLSTNKDRLGTSLTIERITYECGAEYKSISTRNNNTGRAHHCGCRHGEN